MEELFSFLFKDVVVDARERVHAAPGVARSQHERGLVYVPGHDRRHHGSRRGDVSAVGLAGLPRVGRQQQPKGHVHVRIGRRTRRNYLKCGGVVMRRFGMKVASSSAYLPRLGEVPVGKAIPNHTHALVK